MLMRFDPFRELDRLSDEVWGNGRRRATAMPMDAWRDGERFVVQFDLPGIDPASIDVTVERNVLNVSAERRFDRRDGQDWVVSERPRGQFTRQLFLGDTLDLDRLEARYEHGVLTLTIPVAEAAKPRKVDVVAGASGQTAIDAQSAEAA